MDRINSLTVARDLFGPGKHGFQDGDYRVGTAPTDLNAAWFNDFQEGPLRVIEAAQMMPESGNHGLLLAAILWHINHRIVSGVDAATLDGKDSSFFAAAADLLAHIQNRDNPHGVTLGQLGGASAAVLNAHVNDHGNPHGVTLGQLGGASAAALNAHVNDRGNPHQVTLGQLGGAPLDSAVLTGTPTAPTPPLSDNSTRLATTAFIAAALSGAFTQSFGQNGWCRLPNGLMMQWGLATGPANPGVINVTFPVAFPTAAFVGLCSGANRTSLGSFGGNFVAFPTAVGMTITVDENDAGVRQAYWFAVGY